MFHRPSFQVLIKHSYIETLPSTGLFPPWPVAAAAGSSLGLRQVSPMAARTQAHGHHLLLSQEAESVMEQPGFELGPLWDASATGGS